MSMPMPIRLAIVAAVVTVAVGALLVMQPLAMPGVGGPSASPSPTPAPSTGADTSSWVAFTSPDGGYELSHPADWSAFPEGGRTFFSGGAEWGSGISVGRYPTDGLDPVAWAAEHCGRVSDQGINRPPEERGLITCHRPLDKWTSASVDGHQGYSDRDERCCIDIVVFVDDSAYVITGWGGPAADRPLFAAFVSTIRLRP